MYRIVLLGRLSNRTKLDKFEQKETVPSGDANMDRKEIVTIGEVVEEPKFKEPRLAVVIPAFNEAETVGEVVKGAAKYADEVVVVDDGSTDSTSFVARAAGAYVIKINNNSGKGTALSIGLATVALNGADIIVCMDADGQHDPQEIPRLCAPILRNKADLVIGSRFLQKAGQKEIPGYRKLGQTVLTKATNFGNGTKVTDSQSGFRCMTRKAALSLDLTERGMGIESEMVIDADKHGLRILEVPISCRYDGLETSTLRPGKHGTAVLSSILRTIRDEHPLLFFGGGGFLLAVIGISAGLYSLYQFMTIRALPFLPSLVAVLFFFLGLLSIFSGIILNSIAIKQR